MPDPRHQSLADAIAQGGVVLIIGTGASIQATSPTSAASWTGLLKRGLEHAKYYANPMPTPAWHTEQDARLAAPTLQNLLAAATDLETALAAPNSVAFKSFLEQSIGQLTAANPALPQALAALHRPGIALATTNYDTLLEAATNLPAITWTASDKVEAALRGTDPAIIHLHGLWSDAPSVILGTASYDRLIASPHAQSLQQAITLLKTIVFIGCGEDGLSDPNLGRLLNWLRLDTIPGTTPHYLLCRDPQEQQLRAALAIHPRLIIVPYGPTYDDLPRFLATLAPTQIDPLPDPKPLILGRETDIATLLHLLSPRGRGEPEGGSATPTPPPQTPAHILVQGPGGIGKTTLTQALRTHPTITAQYPNRPIARLETALTAEAMRTAITLACNLPATTPFPQTLAHLAATPTLLLLDNLETPFDADQTETESLLATICAIPSLALLASIRGTRTPRGSQWTPHETKTLAPEHARALFLHHATPRFAADPNLPDFLEALDGHPLAIELIALRATADQTLSDLWTEYQSIGPALATRLGEPPNRLSALTTSIELSLSSPRIGPEGRRLFALLGALPSGIADQDRRTLLGDDARPALEQLRLTGLAERTPDRLDLLPPLRDHAARHHKPDPPDHAAWPAHYLALTATEGARFNAGTGAEAIARLAPNLPNLAAAFRAAIAGNTLEPAVAAVDCYGYLVRFSGLGGSAPLTALAAACATVGNDVGQARCLEAIGDIALFRSDHVTAAARSTEALSLYRRSGAVLGEANCLFSLGNNALRRSDHAAATVRFTEALPLFRRTGDILGEANCIRGLGDIALRRSDHATAAARYTEALPLYRRTGDILGEANCIRSVGNIALARADHATATARYTEALPFYRRAGDLLGEANCIKSVGNIALERSDHATASARYTEALPLFRRVGDVLGEANCIQSLGDIAREKGDPAAAIAQYQTALALYTRIPEPYSIGHSHLRLAHLTPSPTRETHLAAAREAWLSIDRPDLVAQHLDPPQET